MITANAKDVDLCFIVGIYFQLKISLILNFYMQAPFIPDEHSIAGCWRPR